MGNGVGKMTVCFTGIHPAADYSTRRRKEGMMISDSLDDLGHSFCYVRPELTRLTSYKVHYDEPTATTFKSISGASVSANTSTPLSTASLDLYSYNSIDRASAFEGSTSFASVPLQLVPRNSSIHSGPLFNSGPIERGFMSGPIERGIFSGPLDKNALDNFRRSYSHGGFAFRRGPRARSFIRAVKRAISRGIIRGQKSIVAPIKGKESEWTTEKQNELTISSVNFSSECSLEDDDSVDCENLQWAQGKAGEDRVHVVVSEEHGWVFVGIYDGFNGPDATDYLLSNLYYAVHKEVKGLLSDDNNSNNNKCDSSKISNSCATIDDSNSSYSESLNMNFSRDRGDNSCSRCLEQEKYPCRNGDLSGDYWYRKKKGRGSKIKYRGVAKKWEESQRRWRCEWDRERLELDRKLKEELHKNGSDGSVGATNHSDVLKALSVALEKTEESYLDLADKMVVDNPELALMGSCVLVMLMKGDDVYVLNVGDSRAVLAQKREPDLWSQDLERINEETLYDLEDFYVDRSSAQPSLTAVQLTMDHSTSVEEEVKRIKNEHLDDPSAVVNDRVKGSLKVTRAFGAGYLKQPNWNKALLEMFRIDYVGTSPYLNCLPSLHHHRLGPRDRFLILSSDGIYQYFTNEEAVSEVELFITWSPEGDPAQHLVEELLFRAAKRAGMDFHELLEVPQGDRRRYHDDVSIIVISFEGKIWRSSA